jgi:hypothetical protein
MGEMKYAYKILVRKCGRKEGRKQLEDLGIGGKIIFEWILEKLGAKVLTGFIWLRRGTSG